MERFIVGTGRCGSTLLSRMLAESRQVLSLSEFFNGLDMTRRFSAKPVSGAAFAELLGQEHPFVSMVLRRGYEVPEIVYPFERSGARYGREGGLPYLLGACLPRLSDDPDALFDAVLDFAAGQRSQPLAQHYPALFRWLARRLGREHWIERSGSSIDYVGSLASFFPEARFVHLHRDGREAALSMREHHAFRLAVHLSSQLLARDTPQPLADLATLDPAAESSGDDPIGRALGARPDPEAFGHFWSGQLERGCTQARALPPERWLDLRFETLLTEPGAALRRIAEFFALDLQGGGWIQRAAALVDGAPPARRDALGADEGRRLDAACAPGMRLLGRAVA